MYPNEYYIISNYCQQIDEVIGQAQATRSVLGTQRAIFGDVQGKVKQLGEKFPVIRGLLGIHIPPRMSTISDIYFKY